MCSNSHTGGGRGGWASGSDWRKIKKAHPKAQSYPQVVHRVWISFGLSTAYPPVIHNAGPTYPQVIHRLFLDQISAKVLTRVRVTTTIANHFHLFPIGSLGETSSVHFFYRSPLWFRSGSRTTFLITSAVFCVYSHTISPVTHTHTICGYRHTRTCSASSHTYTCCYY